MTSTRLWAAAVGLMVLLPAVHWGGEPGTALMIGLAMLIGLDEYARMAFPDGVAGARVWLVGGALPFAASLIWADPAAAQLVAVGVLLGTFARVTLLPPEPIDRAADLVGRYVLGIAWIGGLSAFLVKLRAGHDGFAWLLVPMVIAWCGDTAAYFAGRAFGRTPLHPRVSPKKSVEGFVGGLIGSAAGAVAWTGWMLPGVPVGHALLLGLVGGAMAVLGDLSESLVKRAFDVKDSGWILPGHGGILDRVDSLLFVAPLVYGYRVLIGG
ncbi:MAG: hypothetical protein RLZZ383_196 [Pseudomonadota bacterium]|jgi:phosphatidate cytidylyltransferase